MTIDDMIQDVLRREAGFVNDPADHGGATNHGVTQAEYSAYLGREATVDDVRNMPVEDAIAIFRQSYFLGPHIDTLPEPIQPQTFDICVNTGASRAFKIVQKACNGVGQSCAVDGELGAETIQAATAACEPDGGAALSNEMVNQRLAFYTAIVARDRTQARFLKGWTNRANEFFVS